MLMRPPAVQTRPGHTQAFPGVFRLHLLHLSAHLCTSGGVGSVHQACPKPRFTYSPFGLHSSPEPRLITRGLSQGAHRAQGAWPDFSHLLAPGLASQVLVLWPQPPGATPLAV